MFAINWLLDVKQGRGHCIGNCTPTHDWGQSEVKQSRRNFEAGQAVKLGTGGSLRMVKVSPGNRWAWLMLDSQGSRPDFGAVKGSSMKICWIKILTAVVSGSTGAYVVSPPPPPL